MEYSGFQEICLLGGFSIPNHSYAHPTYYQMWERAFSRIKFPAHYEPAQKALSLEE
jgi:hypothetical protein